MSEILDIEDRINLAIKIGESHYRGSRVLLRESQAQKSRAISRQ